MPAQGEDVAMSIIDAGESREKSRLRLSFRRQKIIRLNPVNMDTFAPPPEELRAMQATAKRTKTNKLTPGRIDRIVATVRKEHKASAGKRRSV